MDVLLGVPLKVIAATLTLNMAAEKAVKVLSVTWYPQAHRLTKVIGLHGLSSFLGCFGLGLAFLSVACGISFGLVVTEALMKRQLTSLLTTVCIGLSVCLGCGLAGQIIGLISITLMTLGLKGLFVTGFILSFALLLICRKTNNLRMTPSRMLVLFGMTFMTMHLSVCSGHNFNSIIIFTVIPAVCLMGFLADRVAFRKSSAYIIVSFIFLVPITGIVIGIGTMKYSLKHSYIMETVNTVKYLVYGVQMLTGLIGATRGALTASSWEEEAVRGLSLWICGPAAVILYNLDIGSPDLNLHSLFREYLGAGGELGLISGFAGASGISLGLTVRRAQKTCPAVIALMVGFLAVVAINYFLPSNSIVILVICPFALWLLNTTENTQEHIHRDKVDAIQEAALDSAILGRVMMGAVVVGVAGLLTAALGSAGFYGVIFSLLVATWNAFRISSE
ncbi:uncharacterized protein LOC115435033 isoform X3 [Sphaeramia orbicularis]|uniref:uncharacterized protein LOC115435033 isoform X3 n=1 Tax=Sphaeramia orbicularis TaxID=375764 RepID=UPI00117E23B1|nr:uncharacterized protein LOC115435033 isoform X3 [Sphaeramia orbicularis]